MFLSSKLNLFLPFLIVNSHFGEPSSRILIDSKLPGAPFTHFWKSTGFCPPDPKEDIYKFFSRDDLKLNLALIGALPNAGIKQVRIHWLFDLIFINADGSYDFTHLDDLIEFLQDHNLKPGFELMGYPIRKNATNSSEIHDSESDFKQIWRNLVEQTSVRYITKFGAQEVSSWRFELWNEPDLKNYNLLNFTLETYIDYVHASATGLKEAFSHTNLTPILGGPAGLFKKSNHPFCWGLLKVCSESECPLDFISFHKKGDGSAEGVLSGTLELLDELQKEFPSVLKKLPIANDESDIIADWAHGYEWRGDVRYAAMVVKVISDYFKTIKLQRRLDLELISNDNGFLNYHPFYFEQRTLFARFQMNLTHPPHNQFIKKPVYAVMALLSLLGNEYLDLEDSSLDIIATRDVLKNQTISSIVISYSNNSEVDLINTKNVKISVKNLIPKSRYTVYLLDNILTNPYQAWVDLKKPVYPSKRARNYLRSLEEPVRIINPTDIPGDKLEISLNLTLPSVVSVHICSKPVDNPGGVENLAIFNITRNEVLLTWSDKSIKTKCVCTFEVEFESQCNNSLEFKRINLRDSIFLSFHFTPDDDRDCEATIGRYRVRVVDFWGFKGEYSDILSYP